MVKKNEVFTLVRHKCFEVGANNAVPSRSVFHLELRLGSRFMRAERGEQVRKRRVI